MRKLNLMNYTVKVKVPDQKNPGQMIEAEFPYGVKDSLLNLLFIPDLQLNGAELVKQNVLAMKIEQTKDDVVSLNEDEYKRILAAANAYSAQSRADVELIDRILNQTPVIE